jgi:hypothetical protein
MARGSVRKKFVSFFLKSFARENRAVCQLAGHSHSPLICDSGERDGTSAPPSIAPKIIVGERPSRPLPNDVPEVGVNGLSPNSLSNDDSSFEGWSPHLTMLRLILMRYLASDKHTKASWFQDSHHFVMEHCNMVDTLNRTIMVNIQGSDKRTKGERISLQCPPQCQ